MKARDQTTDGIGLMGVACLDVSLSRAVSSSQLDLGQNGAA